MSDCVTQSAVRRNRRDALAVIAGFTVANLIWCIAVVLGLTFVFDAQPWLHDALRILGASYLVHLGLQMWRSGTAVPAGATNPDDRPFDGFIRGAITNLSNPKSAVYFASVFAVFLKTGSPLWLQTAAIAIVLVDTIVWYGLVAIVLSAPAAQRSFLRFRRIIDRVAGTLMIAFGLRLLIHRARPAG